MRSLEVDARGWPRGGRGGAVYSVPHFPGLSRDFYCFDFILEWDEMSGIQAVFDSLMFCRVLMREVTPPPKFNDAVRRARRDGVT